jgi:hypothetical protein
MLAPFAGAASGTVAGVHPQPLGESARWLERETAKTRGRKSFDEIEGEGKNYERETIKVRRSNGATVVELHLKAGRTPFDSCGADYSGADATHSIPCTFFQSFVSRLKTTSRRESEYRASSSTKVRIVSIIAPFAS